MSIHKINIKNLVGENNRFLDLTLEKVRFNFDHVFHIPKTIRSLVFFPYHIYVSQVEKLNKYCKENDYTVEFIGGESFYGGGDGPFNPVQTEELFSLDGNWEQIGGVGNYLFYDPTDEVPNDEIFYCEFNNDNSQFTHDTGEVIQIWQRQ